MMLGLFKPKCRYCSNKIDGEPHVEGSMKFCCPNCAENYKQQMKKLEKSYSKKSCCH